MTFPDGDLNPGFLNKFPPKIWIFKEIRSMSSGFLELLDFNFISLYVCVFKKRQGKYSGENKWGENIWETFCIRIFLLSAAQFEKL